MKKIIILIVLVIFIGINILAFMESSKFEMEHSNPQHGITFDYWVWLGCPLPVSMLFIDNYPGHDLTAEFRHENYFTNIPPLYSTYKDVVSNYGEPLKTTTKKSGERTLIYAEFREFTLIIAEDDKDFNQSKVIEFVATSSKLTFTRDKIKVSDSKSLIHHTYRYYREIPKQYLHDGYSLGYIDGSVLTGEAAIEFSFDENDCVKSIMITDPEP